MEFLGKVYDGSEHEVGDGYPLCKADGIFNLSATGRSAIS